MVLMTWEILADFIKELLLHASSGFASFGGTEKEVWVGL